VQVIFRAHISDVVAAPSSRTIGGALVGPLMRTNVAPYVVRSYRENAGGGCLTFGHGFVVGILITLISSACYVGTWEFVYYKLMPNFSEKYAAHMVERVKASGATQQKVDETERQAEQFKQMYANPAINIAMTFAEVFPIGLVVTLVSAGILRKKLPAPQN
jgi:hypothetical protein